MDEEALKEELARQIVEGTPHQVKLAQEKIRTLHEAGLVVFDFNSPSRGLGPSGSLEQ